MLLRVSKNATVNKVCSSSEKCSNITASVGLELVNYRSTQSPPFCSVLFQVGYERPSCVMSIWLVVQ